MVVCTILAHPKNWLKLAFIFDVGNDTSHYLLVVFYLPSSQSPVLKYVTSVASRDIVYKLKPRVIPIYLLYSWIIYNSLILDFQDITKYSA